MPLRTARRRLAPLLPLLLAVACSPPAERPHVLLLTVDTLRADHLSANGHPLPTSPYLDELLAEGVVFEQAIAPIPRTTQALASLLTGLYPHRHGVRFLFGRLPDAHASLAELAREAGYTTVAVVSNHVLTSARGLDRGFDVYDAAGDSRDAAATVRATIDHLRERPADAKLFLWVHFIDPHVPYYPPAQLARDFDPGYDGPYALHFGARRGGVGDLAYPEDLPKWRAVYRNDLPDAVNEHVRKLYAADVRQTDDAIRELDTWLRTHRGRDWLVAFAADHGESLGEHDYFYDHGDYVYQPGLHVPLAFVLPEGHPLRGTGSVRRRVSLVDVMPTLVELLDLPLAPDTQGALQGASLLADLKGREVDERPVFAESGKSFFPQYVRRRVRFDPAGRPRAVLQGDWKLIWTPGAGPPAYELYDLAGDPGETRDLYAPDHPQARRLQDLLREWLADDPAAPGSRPALAPEPDAEDRERLRALGYIE